MGVAALSAILSCFAFRSKEWRDAVKLVAMTLFFALSGWAALTNPVSHSQNDGSGREFAGCPMPGRPSPPHHLAAARELPPSDRTHTLPKD